MGSSVPPLRNYRIILLSFDDLKNICLRKKKHIFFSLLFSPNLNSKRLSCPRQFSFLVLPSIKWCKFLHYTLPVKVLSLEKLTYSRRMSSLFLSVLKYLIQYLKASKDHFRNILKLETRSLLWILLYLQKGIFNKL